MREWQQRQRKEILHRTPCACTAGGERPSEQRATAAACRGPKILFNSQIKKMDRGGSWVIRMTGCACIHEAIHTLNQESPGSHSFQHSPRTALQTPASRHGSAPRSLPRQKHSGALASRATSTKSTGHSWCTAGALRNASISRGGRLAIIKDSYITHSPRAVRRLFTASHDHHFLAIHTCPCVRAK